MDPVEARNLKLVKMLRRFKREYSLDLCGLASMRKNIEEVIAFVLRMEEEGKKMCQNVNRKNSI